MKVCRTTLNHEPPHEENREGGGNNKSFEKCDVLSARANITKCYKTFEAKVTPPYLQEAKKKKILSF